MLPANIILNVCVCACVHIQGSQNVPQPTYQQQLVLQGPTNQTPVPSASMQVYYSVLPPGQHSTVRYPALAHTSLTPQYAFVCDVESVISM